MPVPRSTTYSVTNNDMFYLCFQLSLYVNSQLLAVTHLTKDERLLGVASLRITAGVNDIITKTRTIRAQAVVRISWRLRRCAADRERQTGFVGGQGHVRGYEEQCSRECGVSRCDSPQWPACARLPQPRCWAVAGEAGVGRKAASRRRIPGDPRCSASDARVIGVRRERPASHQYELDWRIPPRDRDDDTHRELFLTPVVAEHSHNKLASSRFAIKMQ